ncbi:hypothetical protein V6N00_13450 [Tersicoccus sp. MR15.9]|uniref:hypothetical protein n=1 Tax=Tersicoccus mangrovi TaxID=3121635 RepID=UPI002FE5EE8D
MNTQPRPTAPYVVAGLITAVVIGLVVMMFFLPQAKRTQALDQQVQAAEAHNASLQTKIDVIDRNKRNAAALKQQVAAFTSSFPAGASQTDLMAEINTAAAAAGVELTGLNAAVPTTTGSGAAGAAGSSTAAAAAADVNAAAAAKANGQGNAALSSTQVTGKPTAAAPTASTTLATVSLTINAQGGLDRLEAFVARLEKLSRPVMIRTFAFGGDEAKQTLSLTATSFFVAPLTDPTTTGAGQ